MRSSASWSCSAIVWENSNFSSNSRKMTLPVSVDNLIERLKCRVFWVKVVIRRILSAVFCFAAIILSESHSKADANAFEWDFILVGE